MKPPASKTDLARLGARVRVRELLDELQALVRAYPDVIDAVPELHALTPRQKDATTTGFLRASKQLRAQWEARPAQKTKKTKKAGHALWSTRGYIEQHWARLSRLSAAEAKRRVEQALAVHGNTSSSAAINSAYHEIKRRQQGQPPTRKSNSKLRSDINPHTGKPYKLSRETREHMATAQSTRYQRAKRDSDTTAKHQKAGRAGWTPERRAKMTASAAARAAHRHAALTEPALSTPEPTQPNETL